MFIDIKDVDQLAVWQSILGPVDVKKRFRNPRRSDSSPGAILKWYGDNLILLDPADDLHNHTCFKALQSIYNITFKEVLEKCIDLKAISTTTFRQSGKVDKKHPFIIKYRPRKWSQKDAPFWNICNISSKQLLKEHCKPVLDYWITNSEGLFKHYKSEDVYANVINNRCKLYGPKNRLFLTNFKAKDIGGFEPLKEDVPLLMTMNLKSYLCLVNAGYNSRYVPSESSVQLGGYKPNYYLMDNDEAGIAYGNKLVKKYGGKSIRFDIQGTYIDAFGNVKQLSDPYDIGFKYGLEELKLQIKRIL